VPAEGGWHGWNAQQKRRKHETHIGNCHWIQRPAASRTGERLELGNLALPIPRLSPDLRQFGESALHM
jgi:hypothetical protein